MEERKYKLYLASGIKLWTTDFKEKYAPYFNHKVDVFYPALIDDQYCKDHRMIPIRIATKDLGEINNRDAVLAYMKMYDTNDNGPAGTDSTWECGYAIGNEKPTIMIVEDLEHLDYYAAQWMVTFSIGAILTNDRAVAEKARGDDKFTHTAILYCENKDQFEEKIIEYLNVYYKSIYAREGIINYEVDKELRKIAEKENILSFLEQCWESDQNKHWDLLKDDFEKIFTRKNISYELKKIQKDICAFEYRKAKVADDLIKRNFADLRPFLLFCIQQSIRHLEGTPKFEEVAEMISYWLSIPAQIVKGRKQGKKKTRPMIFYEIYDLVSHHITLSDRYYGGNFVYRMGAIIEVYNWLNTYAIDDVFDNSDTRQEEETLHVKYKSKKNALLLGSIGHSLSLLLAYDLTKSKAEPCHKILESLNKAQYLMYLGQPVDIDLTMNDKKEIVDFVKSSEFESALMKYFSRIYGICGAFYEEIGSMAVYSTNVGAQFYNQAEAEKACIFIAKLFGIVQMIRNDLGDLIFPEELPGMSKGMKNTSHNDIAEGKFTLPIIYTIFNKNTDASDRKILMKLLGRKKLVKEDKLTISRIVWESGAIDFCVQLIEHFCKLVSNEYIKHINETPTRLKWITKLMDITALINLSFRKLAVEHKWRKLEPMVLEDGIIKKINSAIERENFLKDFEDEKLKLKFF